MSYPAKPALNWSEVFYYDETSPSCLRWNKDILYPNSLTCYKIRKGDVAGSIGKYDKRYSVKYQQKVYRTHRVIYELHYGEIGTSLVIDHIDGNCSDNRICNLRVCSIAENQRNMKKMSSNTTGITGVVKTEIHQPKYGRTYWYYGACWQENGNTKYKYFSILKHGEDVAFKLACDYRAKKIQSFNAQGAGYTERHGT